MREIKFRAWSEGHKKMFSPAEMGEDQLTLMPDGKGFINVSGSSTRLSQLMPHMTPLQYTGLKGKNGVEIYEGDITCRHWDDGTSQNGQIIFENGSFLWQEISQIKFIHPIGINTLHSEVIGNIYENKELLKGGKV